MVLENIKNGGGEEIKTPFVLLIQKGLALHTSLHCGGLGMHFSLRSEFNSRFLVSRRHQRTERDDAQDLRCTLHRSTVPPALRP